MPARRHALRWLFRRVLGGLLVGTLFTLAFEVVVLDLRSDPYSSQRRVRADFDALMKAIKLYKLAQGRFPETLDELWERPEGVANWKGPYLESWPPCDPWGNPYRYRRTRALPAGPSLRSCVAMRDAHGCPTPGRWLAQAARVAAPRDLPDTGPAFYSWGADGLPGGVDVAADLLSGSSRFDLDPDYAWDAELESDLRVIRRAIGAWEQAHPGHRLANLNLLPAHARRLDPWGTPYVYLPETTLVPSLAALPVLSFGGTHYAGAHDPGNYVLFSLGADRAWGGAGLEGDRGWNSRSGAFSPDDAPLGASPGRRVLVGVLSGASVILLPSGVLLLLLWLRRRRTSAPPPPEVVLATLGGRCAYCHDDDFGVIAPCPECGTLLHGSCWLETGSCPSLGCSGRPNASFALPQPPATIKSGEQRPLAAELPAPPTGLQRTA